MPQICKQALEQPICMLLGEELRNCTVPSGSPLFYSLVIYCGETWTESDPLVSINAVLYHARIRSGEVIALPVRMEYPPECTLSGFGPAHFWPSLKHLFSRCCSWKALHDIKSEILMGNQTASRPLAATTHRYFFAVQISLVAFFFPHTSLGLVTHSDMEQIIW